MKKQDFDQLTESLQQAIEYKKGNRKAARSIVCVINDGMKEAGTVNHTERMNKRTDGAEIFDGSAKTKE